jgi:predicted RNA binding protein YcfA (HicA-like mRNA interferase family)
MLTGRSISGGESAPARAYSGEMSLRKEMRQLLREAERQGWRVELGRGGHYKLYAPDGENIVTAPSTPGSGASLRDTLAKMRSFGFRWKGR